ncbi:hypothetical protein BST85_12135 [Aureitalea marina]|uniref:Uncharacterized protein n=2 Tax=Aureitalea marina TaxID=930804 RepID=A0A2S7KSP4_9FLAO|nr:hypothetical protein BST85_12135 [Aureitalea marina]
MFYTVDLPAQTPQSSPPQIAIKLELGQSIMMDDTQLTFTELREDSRCPKYTTCIWAGRARVIVEVKEKDTQPKEFMIILGEVMPDESPNKKVLQGENYTLVVEQLKPYPGDESHTETTPTLLLIKREN